MAGVALSPDNYNNLLEAERRLTSIVSELDNAEKCGIDCQGYRDALRNQLAMISNMKAYYAPKPG